MFYSFFACQQIALDTVFSIFLRRQKQYFRFFVRLISKRLNEMVLIRVIRLLTENSRFAELNSKILYHKKISHRSKPSNIKGFRVRYLFSTASRLHAALRSSANADRKPCYITPRLRARGFFMQNRLKAGGGIVIICVQYKL